MLSLETQHSLNELIRRIYKTAISPDEWEDLLTELAGFFRAHLAANVEHNLSNDAVSNINYSGYTESSVKTYAEHYAHKSVLYNSLKGCKSSKLIIERLAPNFDKVFASETYNDYHLKEGGANGMSLLKSNDNEVISYTIIRRDQKQGAYSEEEAQMAQLLLPHLVQASQISHQFGLKDLLTKTFESAFDQLNTPIFLLTKTSEVFYYNQRAEQLLELGEGLKLKDKKLRAYDANDNGKLQKTLAHVFAINNGQRQQAPVGCQVKRSQSASPFHLTLIPLIQETLESNSAHELTLLTVSDPDAKTTDGEKRIADLYQLTIKEAKVAQAICNGLNTAEIAAEFAISQNAVRFHTKNIYQKLHISRQAELVKLILTGPIGQLLSPPK